MEGGAVWSAVSAGLGSEQEDKPAVVSKNRMAARVFLTPGTSSTVVGVAFLFKPKSSPDSYPEPPDRHATKSGELSGLKEYSKAALDAATGTRPSLIERLGLPGPGQQSVELALGFGMAGFAAKRLS